jgi:uncharacterized glyoxalase superfamily protein PhnB
MKTQRISMVTLAVANIPRAVEFYEKLGWHPSEVNDMVAFFDMNGQKMGMFTLDGLAHETGLPRDQLKTGATTFSQNFNTEDEVDIAWQTAVDAGAKGLAKPRKSDWGGYSGYISDPDGHIWEFAVNPFWTLDGDGLIAL